MIVEFRNVKTNWYYQYKNAISVVITNANELILRWIDLTKPDVNNVKIIPLKLIKELKITE